MLHRASILLIFFLLAALAGSRDIYVATNGAGGGDPVYGAWENAASNIEWAVNVGTNGDNVWISNGTYYLTNQVTVTSNIAIYGFTNNGPAIIDGNNSNRCFYFNSGITGTLASLFITRGYANGSGAGAYIRGGVVRDCIFSNNASVGGGSEVGGGGLYVSPYGGPGLVERCTFIGNTATSGAAMYWNRNTGTVDHCRFFTNTAWGSDGSGGGLVIVRSESVITGCDFICNVASNQAGGAYIYYGSEVKKCLISHCTFSSNVAVVGAGGGLLMYASANASNCYFSNNIATTVGGGIYVKSSSEVRDCVIARNTAGLAGVNAGGGGIYMYAANNSMVQNCIIEENESAQSAGAIYYGSGEIRNCLMRNNTASGNGGAIRRAGAGVGFFSCTIVSNHAGSSGGGISDSASGNTGTYENCIIYFNTAGADGAAVSSNYSLTSLLAMFTNCVIAPALETLDDKKYANASTNNITANPQFVNWEGGNYRLNKGSPCVNTGVNRDWMTGAVDLDSRRRVDRYSGIVDMGCYEYVPMGTMFGVR